VSTVCKILEFSTTVDVTQQNNRENRNNLSREFEIPISYKIFLSLKGAYNGRQFSKATPHGSNSAGLYHGKTPTVQKTLSISHTLP
jgi:hypothetical protein